MPDPLDAVTSEQPACIYAELAANGSLFWDETRQIWIATRAESVRAVLDHDASRVRPDLETIPRSLVGTITGDVFGQLVRMNDGDIHLRGKRAIETALDTVDLACGACRSGDPEHAPVSVGRRNSRWDNRSRGRGDPAPAGGSEPRLE